MPVEIGELANVTSLSAVGTGASTTLVAVSDGQLQRFDPTASAWTPTETLPNDAVAGEVVALDADSFLVGTDKGVARSDDSGASFVLAGEPASWEPPHAAKVRSRGCSQITRAWLVAPMAA